jgi:predicted esterase
VDPVVPFENVGKAKERLEKAGFKKVQVFSFEGPHTIAAEAAQAARAWMDGMK